MTRDLRVAVRSLRKAPGFTAVAVLTLALGIGANTTMFSVLYGVLLRPLPYPQPDQLVQLAQTYREYPGVMDVTYPQFRFLEGHWTGLHSLTATTPVGFNLFADDIAERLNGLRVSRDYFRVLGVAPQLGRPFSADEDQFAGPAVTILSHALWVRRFGGDPGIVGRTVHLDGQPYTIVGVMPAGFRAIPDVDLWSTLAQVGRTIGSGQNLDVLGRLAPGFTLAQARAGLQAITPAFREEFKGSLVPEVGIDLLPYRELVAGPVERTVQVLFGAIAFVLLIACANVANLVLGRAAVREREVAVRVALGAGRSRLVRLLLTESVVLALAGGALGLVLANWGLEALLAFVPADLPRSGEIRLDRWALLFTFGISVLTGILFGLVPAFRATRPNLGDALKEGTGRTTDAPRRGRVRGVLAVAEIALSLMLLVGATLLMRTFANLVRTDPGFEADNLLTAQVWLNGSRYDSTAAISAFYRELTGRLEALPGVRSAAVVEAGLPLERGGRMGVRIDGEWLRINPQYRTVTPNYLATLGVPLLQGRMLTEADAERAEPVAVVNETFARQYLGDAAAVGRGITVGGGVIRRVVGVVGDTKWFLWQPAPPAVFLPSAQTAAGITRLFNAWFPIHVVLRTTVEPAALRERLARTIHDADSQVPVGRVRTMDEVLSGSVATQRFVMLLLSVFAALAVSLAAVGIYGVMSYAAARRTHEIGVRMALGALPGEVEQLVITGSLKLTAMGVGVGTLAAVAVTRLLSSLLFGVTPTDLASYAIATGVLGTVAMVAGWLPARRAARVDPVEALRYE